MNIMFIEPKVLMLIASNRFLLLVYADSISTQDIIFIEYKDVLLKHNGNSAYMNFLVTQSRYRYSDFDSNSIMESGIRFILLSVNVCTKNLYLLLVFYSYYYYLLILNWHQYLASPSFSTTLLKSGIDFSRPFNYKIFNGIDVFICF